MENWKQKVTEEAKLRGYSQKTIKNYCHYIERFLQSNKKPREFLLGLINKEKAENTIRTAGFAIKFYLCATGQKNGFMIPNVKRPKKLPIILSKEEIQRMIKITQNVTHRLIIQLAYAAGLRMSEVINLQWRDIDFDRAIIHIKNAKGKKDRIVMLSKKVKNGLDVLGEVKQGHVFKTNRNGKYTSRTIQKVVENAARKAGIKKKVTPHSLRHTFATHLLENGTDIRHIQELLGHANLSTTMIYTKVSNQNITNIRSPLDM
jgi:integrase/recombinase XerD